MKPVLNRTFDKIALRIRRATATPDDYRLFLELLPRIDRQGDYEAALARITNLENKFNLLTPLQTSSIRRGL